MRIAFVSIPHFPCAVEAQCNPRLAHAPLIVGDAEQPKCVLDCSFSASARGVRRGMTIRQAAGHCPDAVIVPPDPVRYRNFWDAILQVFDNVTPEVEAEEVGSAYLNVGGLQLAEADLCNQVLDAIRETSGLNASIGLATGKFPAFATGTTAAPGGSLIVSPGNEAEFLAPLSPWLLPCDEETLLRLHHLGLERLSDIAALSLPELQSQFGFEGRRLWQLANGIDDEPLRARRHSQLLQASISLESPVAGIDVMIAIARQLLSRLKPSLRGRAARELTLQAELTSGRGWEHHLVFREPVGADERLTFLLRSALTNFPPPQAIRSLSLLLRSLVNEAGNQLSLDGKSRQQRQLEEAIAQLKTRYGRSPVYRCVDVEPWSVIPEERQILVESDA